MSTNGAAAIPNDLELKRLAAEPARPLFPLLDQAEAMLPLVLVLLNQVRKGGNTVFNL